MTPIDPTLPADFRAMRDDYAYQGGIFARDAGRVAAVKWIIQHRLPPADRTIIILYADCHSYRKLAARMGCSHTTVQGEVLRIKKKILQEYEKIKDNADLF